jgi:hypothetical protein
MLRADVWGCLRCIGVFALLLLTPGLCVAWAGDVAGFRRQGAMGQLLWSVALSFAVVPIAAVMAAKYWSMDVVLWAVLPCAVLGAGLSAVAMKRDKDLRLKRSRALGMTLGLGWVLFVIGELVDVGVGNRLYMSVTVFDHALRTAFVDAVMRGGVPPANPLYWPGHAAPMRYYYFWYVVTAAAARLARATARQAMIASVVWAAFGLAAMVALYCGHFLPQAARADELPLYRRWRWGRTALAIALLGVTGLDILPAIAKALLRMPTDADMDWWAYDQVGSWMDSVLWVPHHIAGLVCCLVGFLLVWMSKGERGWRRWISGVVAGVAFASAFGLSTWVALAFALVMAGWMVWVLLWEAGSRARISALLLAGVVAVAALLPYLAELRSAQSSMISTGGAAESESSVLDGPAGGTPVKSDHPPLLRFGVRHMIAPEDALAIPGMAALALSHPQVEDAVSGLILLLPEYFTELGFFFLVLVAAIGGMRRGTLREAERTALALVGAGLLVSTFLRSTVIANNDFGIRSILIVQFFLLLLAVRWCEGGFGETGRAMRRVAIGMVCLGVVGTVYQVALLRVYLPMEERLGRPESSGLGEEAMALRQAFAEMDALIPKAAVVQFNPLQPGDYFHDAQILPVGRQVAAAFPDCPAAFGGEASRCDGVEAGVRTFFAPQTMTFLVSPGDERRDPHSAEAARAMCSQLGIDYLIATQWDDVWADRSGWVWRLPAVVDTGEVRVVQCAP